MCLPGGDAIGGYSESEIGEAPPGFDLPVLDLGGLSFDLGAFESFEGVFESIGSALDSGGFDGGDGDDSGGGD